MHLLGQGPGLLGRIMGQYTSNESSIIELHRLGSHKIVDALLIDRNTSHAGKDFVKMECEVWIFC